jgi:probable O-glycosylation ligase (exosortase A-associated)
MQALPVRPASRGADVPRPPAAASLAAVDAPAAAAPTWSLGRASVSGSGVFFFLFLVLIFVEFTGLPNQYQILKVTRFSTLLSYGLVAFCVLRNGLSDVVANRAAKLLIAFLVLTWMSMFWAYVRIHAFNSVRPLVDYLGLMIITAYLLDRKSRMEWFAATFSCAAIWLVYQNFEKLNAGGPRRGSFSAPYFMGDGNDFAWWLALCLPLAFSLVVGRRSIFIRALGLTAAGACLLGVMGTQSRGAFLGVGGAFLYGWLFVSKKKWIGAVAVGVVAVGMIIAAPAGYFTRMNTVTNYQQDNSAQARIQAWTAGVQMAMSHPLGVGAGNFPSAYGRFYIPSEGSNRVGWGGRRWVNAHSIYFKVLGEYGFPGLIMLLGIIISLLVYNTQSRRAILAAPEGAPLDDYWPAFVSMSTIACAMCGIFLGGFNYPHLFILTGICIAIQRIVRLESGSGVQRVLAGQSVVRRLVPATAPIGVPVARPR